MLRTEAGVESTSRSNLSSTALRVAGKLGHGAGSTLKTSVLRQDRVAEADYQSRLATCGNCPGGHATFRNGKLHTCGPMLESLKGAGQGTCGCVLSKKARDAKETCPFGYWPTLAGQPQLQRLALPVLNAQAGKLKAVEAPVKPKRLWLPGLPGLAGGTLAQSMRPHLVTPRSPGRRRFLSRAAAVLAGLVLGPKLLWGRDSGANCYVKLDPCQGGTGDYWISCDSVGGMEVGKIIRATGGTTNGCYELLSTVEEFDSEPTTTVTLSGSHEYESCAECAALYELTPCPNETGSAIITSDAEANLSAIAETSLSDFVDGSGNSNDKAIKLDDDIWYTVDEAESGTAVAVTATESAEECPTCGTCNFSEDSTVSVTLESWDPQGNSRTVSDAPLTFLSADATHVIWQGPATLTQRIPHLGTGTDCGEFEGGVFHEDQHTMQVSYDCENNKWYVNGHHNLSDPYLFEGIEPDPGHPGDPGIPDKYSVVTSDCDGVLNFFDCDSTGVSGGEEIYVRDEITVNA